MDNNVFIDDKTYDKCNNIFNCDKRIADAIIILNKKGYKTLASCEGHNKSREGFIQEKIDLGMLDDVKNDPRHIILNINDDDFEVMTFKQFAQIYILFDDVKLLPNIPNGFVIQDNKIEHLVLYYDKNNARYTNEYIDNQIDKYNKILKEWANKLPYIKERNDINE